MGFYIIEPADEDRWDKNRETEEHKGRIYLGWRRGVYQVEFDGEDCHHEKCHERESRSQTGYSVGPINRIKYHDVPEDCKNKRDEVNMKIAEVDVVLVKIENSSEYIGYISDLYARDSNNRSYSDLHKKSYFGRNKKWRITAHFSELLSCFFDIALAFTVKFMNRIEIIYETYNGHHCTKYQDNKESILVYVTQEGVEKK